MILFPSALKVLSREAGAAFESAKNIIYDFYFACHSIPLPLLPRTRQASRAPTSERITCISRAVNVLRDGRLVPNLHHNPLVRSRKASNAPQFGSHVVIAGKDGRKLAELIKLSLRSGEATP